MKIALDYDGTYTKDPQLWDQFIALARKREHEVIIVTQRIKDEEYEQITMNYSIPIHYTARRPKIWSKLDVDIWIDNNPYDIVGYPDG